MLGYFRLQMTTNLVPKSTDIFYCEFCDYSSCRKSHYQRHLSTGKHSSQSQGLQETTKKYKKYEKVPDSKFICECGNKYKHHSSLWKHKNKCKLTTVIPNNSDQEEEEEDMKSMIKYFMKENSELKTMILDVCKNMQPLNSLTNSNNNNNTNSNNKTFNLQFFLNETCKDAMNLVDFVDSIKLQLTDLENVGKSGFVDGISNIIVKNLKALDVTKRPVHCSDFKREVIYVKDQDQWVNDSKEEPNNQKLKKAINHVAHKNICMIPKWKEKYPDCVFSESKKSEQYNHIIYESMSQNEVNTEKIIKKIAKEVTIVKNEFIT